MRVVIASLFLAMVVASCGGTPPAASATQTVATGSPATSAEATVAATTPAGTAAAPAGPAFMTTAMKDVRTGETFTIGGFPGKTVMVIAMAVW